MKRLMEINFSAGRYFFGFFWFLPEISHPKALRKIEGRWMSSGHPFSADRSETERCLG